MKATLRSSSWIVTIPLVAVAVGYMTLVFVPGRRAIGELRDEIDSKQEYVDRAAGLAAALRLASEKLQQAEAYDSAWQRDAPDRDELTTLYASIHQLAKAAGATPTRFDPEPIIPHDTLSEVPLVMGCTGSFSQHFGLLRGLDGVAARIWINELRLEPTEASGENVLCEIKMAVFTNNPDSSDYVKDSE